MFPRIDHGAELRGRPDSSVGALTRRLGRAVLNSGVSKTRHVLNRRQLTESSRCSERERFAPYHKVRDSYTPSYRRPYRATLPRVLPRSKSSGSKVGEVLDRNEYFPGLIFRAAHYEEAYDRNLDPRYLIEDEEFGHICRKVRKFIVVACYEESFVAVPLYTFNGSGLDRKVEQAKDQYVSIHDHRSMFPGPQLSKHQPLLTQSLDPEVNRYIGTTVCHITGVHSRWYSSRVVKEGYLTEESVDRLRALPGVIERREITTNSPYEKL